MLYQKVRPNNIIDIIGNDSVVKAVQQLFNQTKRPHSFILKGPSGCGKTTLALIIAAGFDCKSENIIKLNVANVNGIDAMRRITNEAHTYGMGGGNKVYILDEAHQLTKDAQNEMLEILEFYPNHCYFILCTTKVTGIIKTVRNRCTEYELNKLTEEETKTLLNNVCELEKLEIDQDLIEAIACTCDGSPRAALVSLEQIIGTENIDEALELLVKGTTKDTNILDLCKLLTMDPKLRHQKWQKIIRTFNTIKVEPEIIRKSIMTFTYNKLVRCEKVEVAIDYEHLLRIFSVSTFYGGKSAMGALVAKACLSIKGE